MFLHLCKLGKQNKNQQTSTTTTFYVLLLWFPFYWMNFDLIVAAATLSPRFVHTLLKYLFAKELHIHTHVKSFQPPSTFHTIFCGIRRSITDLITNSKLKERKPEKHRKFIISNTLVFLFSFFFFVRLLSVYITYL